MYSLQAQVCTAIGGPDSSFKIVRRKTFGAEIVGFNFKRGPTAEQLLALRGALVEHKMLLIRDKALTPPEQIALTRIFGGTLHRAGEKLRYLSEHPEVFCIANRPGTGNTNTGQYWHSDGHYLEDPSAVTVMHIVNATRDGATWVADSAAAYERLPEITKQILAQHSFLNLETGVSHPIVRPHPLTGRHGLYVNLNAQAIDGRGRKIPMISEIIKLALDRCDRHYEHFWQNGETMIIDNFASIHRGTSSDPSDLRVMHRTSVAGPAVWWRKKSISALPLVP